MKRYITTGCGKGTTFYNVMDARLVQVQDTGIRVTASQVLNLVRDMQKLSELYQRTGGVHCCALCSSEEILVYREDIGRHNATDKITGKCLLEKIPLENKLFVTSGRISSEILLKVAKMGIPVILSRSAPSDLAVRLAQEVGVTLVGFVRGQRMNIYTHPSVLCNQGCEKASSAVLRRRFLR